MTEFTGEILKTEWVIKGSFGKRRVWKDNGGHFYVVNNIAFRNYPGDDRCDVYKSERVTNIRVGGKQR